MSLNDNIVKESRKQPVKGNVIGQMLFLGGFPPNGRLACDEWTKTLGGNNR